MVVPRTPDGRLDFLLFVQVGVPQGLGQGLRGRHTNRPFAQLWPGNEVRGIAGENRLRRVCFSFELSSCFSFALECRSAMTLVLLAVPIEAGLVLHSSFIVFYGKVSSGSAGCLPFVRLTDRTSSSPTARSYALSSPPWEKFSLSCSYLRACELFHHQFFEAEEG